MFQTVRHWWTGGRGKVTARLFLFEFAVVVVGVLVAQWLANVVQERADYRRMEEARASSLADLAMAAKVSTDWQRLHQCMVDQMTEIMDRLARRQPLPADLITEPGTRYIRMNAPAGEDFLLLGRRYGSHDAEYFRFGQSKVENLRKNWIAIGEEWGVFQLVDPATGNVEESDRTEVRRAAARIRALILRSANVDAGGVLGAAGQLGVRPDDPIGGEPARDCAEFHRAKALYPDLSGRDRDDR